MTRPLHLPVEVFVVQPFAFAPLFAALELACLRFVSLAFQY